MVFRLGLDQLSSFEHIFLQLGVEAVLNSVVGSAWERLCDFTPFVPIDTVFLENEAVLLL
jgi:hypothetical protein